MSESDSTEREQALEFINQIYFKITELLEQEITGPHRIRISRRRAQSLAALDEQDIPSEYLNNFHQHGINAFDGLFLPKIVPPFLPVYVAKNQDEEPKNKEGFVIEKIQA